MIDHPISTVLLAPILVLQGGYVRLVTPKLEEPDGDRSGVKGQGDALRILILGDSAGAGVGVDSQSEALSGQLIQKLQHANSIHWRVEAETGKTTEDILNHIQNLDAFEVDIAVISLGVNDVTGFVTEKRWLLLQEALHVLLRDKFGTKLVLHSSVPPLHKFPALPQPLRWFLGRKAKLFNASLERLLGTLETGKFVSAPFEPDEAYFAEDGFHPNHRAYDLWAETLVKEMKKTKF